MRVHAYFKRRNMSPEQVPLASHISTEPFLTQRRRSSRAEASRYGENEPEIRVHPVSSSYAGKAFCYSPHTSYPLAAKRGIRGGVAKRRVTHARHALMVAGAPNPFPRSTCVQPQRARSRTFPESATYPGRPCLSRRRRRRPSPSRGESRPFHASRRRRRKSRKRGGKSLQRETAESPSAAVGAAATPTRFAAKKPPCRRSARATSRSVQGVRCRDGAYSRARYELERALVFTFIQPTFGTRSSISARNVQE